jgi:hypothetical protein
LFNTGVNTLQTLRWNTSYDDPYDKIPGRGDGTLLHDTLYWPCEIWNGAAAGKAVVCQDFDQEGEYWSHIAMLYQPEFIDTVWNVTTSDDWVRPGNRIIRGKR